MSEHVEWIDAGHPFGSVDVVAGGKPWWDGQQGGEPEPDDVIPGQVGVVFSGDDVVVLTGSFTKVAAVLRSALTKVMELEQAGGPALDSQCSAYESESAHCWYLMEAGIVRTWAGLEIDAENKALVATSNGWGDYSDDGYGVYLKCMHCDQDTAIPEDWSVDYR